MGDYSSSFMIITLRRSEPFYSKYYLISNPLNRFEIRILFGLSSLKTHGLMFLISVDKSPDSPTTADRPFLHRCPGPQPPPVIDRGPHFFSSRFPLQPDDPFRVYLYPYYHYGPSFFPFVVSLHRLHLWVETRPLPTPGHYCLSTPVLNSLSPLPFSTPLFWVSTSRSVVVVHSSVT